MLVSTKKKVTKENFNFKEIVKSEANIKMFTSYIRDLIIKKYCYVWIYFYSPTNEVCILYSDRPLIDILNITSDEIYLQSQIINYTNVLHNTLENDIKDFLTSI